MPSLAELYQRSIADQQAGYNRMGESLANYAKGVVTGRHAKRGLQELANTVQSAATGDTQAAIDMGLNFNPMSALAIKAFHGSPHKFDQFKLDKIGTGEGAQAYGHGLYFAESPGVAKAYQEQLRPLTELMDLSIGGVPLYRRGRPVDYSPGRTPTSKDFARASLQEDMLINDATFRAAYNKGGAPEAQKAMRQQIVSNLDYAKRELPDYVPFYEEVLSNFDNNVGNAFNFKKGQSYMYNVELEHPASQLKAGKSPLSPEDLLDWDKPLSQQSEKVRKALEPVIQQAKKSFPNINPDEMTGQGLYHAYAQHRGGNQDYASEALKQFGIPGIKYLDQGSRGSGQGTSNFVIFDDELVKILGRE